MEMMEDPVDMREEFRKVHSENMVTMNRMIANGERETTAH
jgi:hypothetical protein